MQRVFMDLTGQVFGRLTVLDLVTKNPVTIWRCRCACGTITEVRAGNLGSGNTKTCGCSWGEAKTVHGHNRLGKRTATYTSWSSMLTRCLNPKCRAYPNY